MAMAKSGIEKVRGRLGNTLPRDRYYVDWSARITDASRVLLANLPKESKR